MNNIIFISFDIRKDEYPSISYSIASLMAILKVNGIKANHYSVDLQHALEEKKSNDPINVTIVEKLRNNLDYIKKFSFVAISLTSWTIEYCHVLLNMLSDYKGKVILGGYEVTSRSEEDLLKSFPRADYFIKGYAEKALLKLLSETQQGQIKVISEKIDSSSLVSPYLSEVIQISSRKLHWETKRGCPHSCGFCEWGNATKNIVFIDNDRLLKEIELFKESNIDEINILDGTFNFGKYYLNHLRMLLEIPGLKITCQARFENLGTPAESEFLALCKEHKDRVHLEFGLQTIHKIEMETIGRTNNLDQVLEALKWLKSNNLSFEVSIIYAIPGQTVESFIDTIEFLIMQGCKTIKAYPLSIPKNSKMHGEKDKLCVVESKNRFNVASVNSSYSFCPENRTDMDNIAERLNSDKLFTDIESFPASGYFPDENYIIEEKSQFQWEVVGITREGFTQELIDHLSEGFWTPTMVELDSEDFYQASLFLGQILRMKRSPRNIDFINDLLSGRYYYDLARRELPEDVEETNELITSILKRVNKNLIPRRYKCKFRISRSRNIYVFREITLLDNLTTLL